MVKFTCTCLSLCLSITVLGSSACGSFTYYVTQFTQHNGVDTFDDGFSDGLEPPSHPVAGADVEYNVRGTFGSDRESGGRLELNSEDVAPYGDMRMIGAGVDSVAHFFSPGSTGYVLGEFEIDAGFSPNSFFGILMGLHGTADAYMLAYADPAGTVYAVWGSPRGDTYASLTSGLGMTDITSDLAGLAALTMKLRLNDDNQVTALFDYGCDGSFDLVIPNFAALDLYPSNGRYPSGSFIAGEPACVPAPSAILLASGGLAGLSMLWRKREG